MGTVFAVAITFINYFIQAMSIAIFLRAIFSWFVQPGSDNAIMRFLRDVTEPILAPLRKVLPSMGALDLSFFVAMILLQVMGNIVTQTLLPLAR